LLPSLTHFVAEPAEPTKEEPSVRFTDWTQVPDIGSVHFDYDKSELKTEDRDTLKKNADYLNGNPGVNVLVEGHCDERGTIEYNLALGQKRAAAVREYYGQLGVALGRIGTISYGSEKPADPAHNENAWAKNRRAETKIRSIKQAADNPITKEQPKDAAINSQAPVNPAAGNQTPDSSKTQGQ
jgi:peptidoglycan-associated lipoprotein